MFSELVARPRLIQGSGTGIFVAAGRVMQGTESPGATIMFWFAGALYALAGMHVYIEYGLHVPRRKIDGLEQGVPRSGGDLNYVKFYPRFQKLSVCSPAAVTIRLYASRLS
jgi:hypothetical protein